MADKNLDKFLYLKSTDPAAAKEFLSGLSEKDLAALHAAYKSDKGIVQTQAAPSEKLLSSAQLNDLAAAARNFRNYIRKNNLSPNDVPEFKQILDSIPDSQLNEFKQLVSAVGLPQGHPDVGPLARFSVQELSTPDDAVVAARKFLPEHTFDVRMNPEGNVEVKRKDEAEFKQLDPGFTQAVSEGNYKEILQDILEIFPNMALAGIAGTLAGGPGAAVGMRAGGQLAKAVAPAMKLVTRGAPKTLPRVGAYLGHAAGSGAGEAAFEGLRQTAGLATGTVSEYSPELISQAGTAGAIAGTLTGVPAMPGTGKFAWLGESPGAVQSNLRAAYPGKRKSELEEVFNIRDVQPVKRKAYQGVTGIRSLMSEESLSPEFLAKAERQMQPFMKRAAFGERTGRSGVVKEMRDTIGNITRVVDRMKEDTGNELNRLYNQIPDSEKLDFSVVQKKFEDARNYYLSKADISGHGLSYEDEKILKFLDNAENKLFTRTFKLKESDFSPEELQAYAELKIPPPSTAIVHTPKMNLVEARKMKEKFQDMTSRILNIVKDKGWNPILREKMDIYGQLAKDFQKIIDDEVTRVDMIRTLAAGKQVGPTLGEVNERYSRILAAERNLREHGLYNKELTKDKSANITDALEDLTPKEIDELGPDINVETINAKRLQKGLNTIRGVGKDKDSLAAIDDTLRNLEMTAPGLQGVRKKMEGIAIQDLLEDMPGRPTSINLGGRYGGLQTTQGTGLGGRIARAKGLRKYLSPEAQVRGMAKPYEQLYPALIDQAPPIWRPFTKWPIDYKQVLERGAWREIAGPEENRELATEKLKRSALEILTTTGE